MVGNYSISKKLTWMNMLVSVTALLLACMAFIAYDLATFRQATVSNLSIQAQFAGANTVSAMLFDDSAAAENTLSALRAAPNIVSAGIVTLDGRAFATYSRNPGMPTPALPLVPQGQTETYQYVGGNVLLVRTILFNGKPVETVYVVSDLQRLYSRLTRYVGISAVVLIVSLLATLLISPIFQRTVAEPVTRLARTARTVSLEKNYSIRADKMESSGELALLIDAFNEMLAQIEARDAALESAREQLEQRVEERTRELATINKELETFSYSVSHDLRAPLRSIDGFSQALLEDYADKLDSTGQDHLQRVRRAAQRMAMLIDDILNLSRVARSSMRRENLDLSTMVRLIASDLQEAEQGRHVDFVIEDGLTAEGDSQLIRLVMENLLRNAWKYTSGHARAQIEFGRHWQNGKSPFFVRDDGAGFDPRYAERLFGVFQRLHAATEFPGTGVGLATVQRIIHRHGGEIWAEGAVEKGATFYFTL